MLTQEQINKDWTVRSDNYNNYVEEEFATDRPKKWLELIESQAPDSRPLRILDAGCGPGFFSVLLSKAGHQVTGIDRNSPQNLSGISKRNCIESPYLFVLIWMIVQRILYTLYFFYFLSIITLPFIITRELTKMQYKADGRFSTQIFFIFPFYKNFMFSLVFSDFFA